MSGTDSQKLANRLDRFRQMAEEARVASLRATTPELRTTYEELARSWEQLIIEMEQYRDSQARS
jgi:hypothetical protein